MPEPVTIILIGAAAYAWFKGRQEQTGSLLPGAPGTVTLPGTIAPSGQIAPTPPDVPTVPSAGADGAPISTAAAGTGPDAPFATNGSIAVATGTELSPVPSDLVDALDNQTALAMRAYATLNPGDLEAFLNRYADRLVLRNDLYFEALTDPPEAGYQLTPAMVASLGNATYKVAQALNGVYVGRSVDLFGVTASVAGQIPGINPDLVSSLQGLAMGYRAITSFQQVASIAAANSVSLTDLSALTSLGGAAGAYPGLAALPLSGVLMAVGLVVDIGFTIIGDKPDLQKAIDVALDVASLAVLFIPVIGIVIAIVIQLVKFIIDMFGEDLFGGGMSHDQREALEAARYGENISPMWPQIVNSFTPRECWASIVEWGSGYCGGRHIVAMSVTMNLNAGDVIMVGGRPYTVPAMTTLAFGRQPCSWLSGTPFENMSNDEQAWALAKYATKNGINAMAQAGIREDLKTQFNEPTRQVIMARCAPMATFINHGVSLDQIDQIAAEYRAQPHLNELATAFGWPTWQEMFGSVVADEWLAFRATLTNGSLTDFARRYGYQTMYAFRATALSQYDVLWSQAQSGIQAARGAVARWQAAYEQAILAAGPGGAGPMSTP